MRFWPVSDEKISLEYKLKRFLEGSLMPPERAHVYWNGTFSDAEKAALVAPDCRLRWRRSSASCEKCCATTKEDLGPYLWFDQKYYLPDDILVKSDRMSMAHAVELRPPFLDHRIVEFAATLPASLKIRGSRQKFAVEGIDEGQAAAIDAEAEEDWLRHSRARMGPRSSPFARAGYLA